MARSRQDLLALFQATATEIVGSMERQLKIQIPDEMLAGIQTVKDLVDAVEKREPQ
jgi:acyl carrier protein